jgi:hypothetical protein
MSFDVFIGDPTGDVGITAWNSGLRQALDNVGATYSEGMVMTADGHEHQIFGPESDDPGPGCMLGLHELNQEVCALIFEIAQQTKSYVFSDDLIIKLPNAPDFDFQGADNPFFTVQAPAELCKALAIRFGGLERS